MIPDPSERISISEEFAVKPQGEINKRLPETRLEGKTTSIKLLRKINNYKMTTESSHTLSPISQTSFRCKSKGVYRTTPSCLNCSV